VKNNELEKKPNLRQHNTKKKEAHGACQSVQKKMGRKNGKKEKTNLRQHIASTK